MLVASALNKLAKIADQENTSVRNTEYEVSVHIQGEICIMQKSNVNWIPNLYVGRYCNLGWYVNEFTGEC